MDPALKRIAGMTLITVLITLGLLVLFDNNFEEEDVRSQIDEMAYNIDGISDSGVNITIRFGVTIENYGVIKDKVIPCSTVQSYLKIKNTTTPLLPYQGGKFAEETSYYLNSTYFESNCVEESTTVKISENVINNIVVAVSFHFVSGSYAFIWEHSLADAYDAGVINIDLNQGKDGITTELEVPQREL